MQIRNLLLFMLVSAVSIAGWALLQSWVGRPQDRKPTPAATQPDGTAKVDAPKDTAPPADTALSRNKLSAYATILLQNQPFAAAAYSSYFLTIPAPKVEEPKVTPPPPKIVKKTEPPVPPEEIALGDDSFKLKAHLTTLGGGVRDVTLTQFQAANQWGQPAVDDNGNPVPLHLVPGKGHPSNLLYHYAKPEDNRPVDTLGNLVWKVQKANGQVKETLPDGTQKVVFEAELPEQKLRILKIFTLNPGDYHIGLTVRLERTGAPGPDTPKFKYQLTGAHGLPIEGEWYTYTYRNALAGGVDPKGNDWRVLEDSRQISHWGGGDLHLKGDKAISYGAVAIQYFASAVAVDDQQTNKDFVAAVRATLEQSVVKGKIVEFGADHFVLLLPNKTKQGFELQAGNAQVREDFAKVAPGQEIAVVWTAEGDHAVAKRLLNAEETNPPLYDDITVRLISEPLELKAQQTVEHKYLLYNGPVKVKLLGQLVGDRAVKPELVERYENALHLNTLTDFHSPGWGGSFASTIGLSYLIIKFTNLMHWLLWELHKIIPVWGLCIIFLTVIVRGIMFPVSRRQTNNQMAMQEKMAKLAPEVKKLEEKYKGDYNALNQAKTQLYMQHGINPLSTLGGCLLMFAQLPVFLGLYYALQESIHFRLQPFLWIANLAAPDMLFEWGTGIWGISTPSAQVHSIVYLGPFFNLLPVVAVALMIVQQKMMTPPATDEQQELQQKMMKWMMIVFGFMFYKVAAGLCIYFIASSLWGLAERKLFPKPTAPKPGEAAAASPPEGGAQAPRPRSERPTGPNGRGEPQGNGFRQRLWQRWQDLLKEAGKQQQARSDRDDRERDRDRGKKKKRR